MTKGVQDRMVAVEQVRDAFHAAIYQVGDLDAALSFVSNDCVLEHFPPGRGATGINDLRRYLAEEVLPHLPADLDFRRVSRTGDRWRVAQEDMVSFTHDRELPWLLPGVTATGRRAEVLAISVVTVAGSVISSHRTLWDRVSLATQLELEEIRGVSATG